MTPGQVVLVNGATGISGRLAVQIAKLLGAGKVIATGRDAGMLQKLSALGADATVSLLADDAALDAALTRHFSDGVDIVLDYLWGASAERLLAAAAKTNKNAKPVRFIQIGSSGRSEHFVAGDDDPLVGTGTDRLRHGQSCVRSDLGEHRGGVQSHGAAPAGDRAQNPAARQNRGQLGDRDHVHTDRLRHCVTEVAEACCNINVFSPKNFSPGMSRRRRLARLRRRTGAVRPHRKGERDAKMVSAAADRRFRTRLDL